MGASGVMEGAVAAPGADAGADASARLPKNGTPLNVRIDDVWYDLSGWRSKHPGAYFWNLSNPPVTTQAPFSGKGI